MTTAADGSERTVGTLRITVDRTLCVGFGDCVGAAPAAFQLDSEGIAMLVRPQDVAHERLLRACASCPVDAIQVTDRNGNLVLP